MKEHVLKYYEWTDIESRLIRKLGGRNLRDFAGKWEAGFKERPDVPYLDFWHWWLENAAIEPVNGTYQSVCVSELIEEKQHDAPAWVMEILRAMEKVLGKLKDKPINIHYEW